MTTRTAIAEIRSMLREIRRDHMLSGCVNDVKTIITAYNAKRQALQMAIKALEENEVLHKALERIGQSFAVECDHYDGEYWKKYFIELVEKEVRDDKQE